MLGSSLRDGALIIEAKEGSSADIRDVVENMKSMCATQHQRISRFKAIYNQRSASVASSNVSNSAAATTFNLKCAKRWNQDLQCICENRKLNCFEKFSAVNRLLTEFGESAEQQFKQFIQQYLSDDASDADAIPWASAEEKEVGATLNVQLVESNLHRHTKEFWQQSLFLSQELMFYGSSQPPIAIFPRVVVHAMGRTAIVSAEVPFVGPSRTVLDCPEFKQALELTGSSLNLAPYRRQGENFEESVFVGPPSGSVRVGADGRYYVESLFGWCPRFPPTQGVAAGDDHCLFLLPEFFTHAPQPLSPGAFCVFGSRDSAQHSKTVRTAATSLCQEVIPQFAAELVLSVPSSGKELTDRMHQCGINIGLLPIVWLHLASESKEVRAIVLAEMAARASRSVIETSLLEHIDVMDMYDEISGFCAALCDEERRESTWNEQLVPVLKEKFPGFTLMRPSPSGSTLDLERWLNRLQELMGIKFAEGVDSKGSSSFHFSIDSIGSRRKLFLLPEFRLGKMKYKETGGLAPQPSPRTQPIQMNLLVARLAMERNPEPQQAITEFVNLQQQATTQKSFAYGCGLLEAGSLLRRLKRAEEAAVFLDKAIEALQSSNTGTTVTIGRAYRESGLAAAASGVFKTAVKNLTMSIKVFTELAAEEKDTDGNIAKRGIPFSILAVESEEELATLYEQKGLLEEAEPLYRSALLKLRQVYGKVNPLVSAALNNLACNLFSQENFDEAETLYKEDIEVTEALFHDDSVELATSLNNLAAVYGAQNRPEDAEPLYRRDLEITMKALGPDHDDVATARNNLATCLQKLGKIAEAEKEYIAALKIRRAHKGERHASVADFLTNLGALKLSKGDPVEGKKTFEEALGIYEETLGRNHHLLRRCLDHLANLCESLGLDEEAEMYSERLMDLKRADNDIYSAQQAAVKSTDGAQSTGSKKAGKR